MNAKNKVKKKINVRIKGKKQARDLPYLLYLFEKFKNSRKNYEIKKKKKKQITKHPINQNSHSHYLSHFQPFKEKKKYHKDIIIPEGGLDSISYRLNKDSKIGSRSIDIRFSTDRPAEMSCFTCVNVIK